ncbi:MAG: hypothetical protein ACXVAN_09330 [Polyangia bacterium]
MDTRARLRRLALPAGLAWLALLTGVVARFVLALVRDLGQLRPVGLATIADRMSQLKPWPWKAPQAFVPIALLVALAAAAVIAAVVAAARATVRDRKGP